MNEPESRFRPIADIHGSAIVAFRMSMESLLLTIEGSAGIGAAAGLLVGILCPGQKVGCVVLLAVPLAMIAFVSWWQAEHPENLRSTSGLDFVFGPLWPSLGAIAGYYIGMLLRGSLETRRQCLLSTRCRQPAQTRR